MSKRPVRGPRGERVYLRPLEPEDADLVSGWYADDRVRRLLGDPPTSYARRRQSYGDAALNADPVRVRELLVAQVTAPVRWVESMRLLQTLGCRRAIEVGPGQVLSKLLQRMRLGVAGETLESAVGVEAAGAQA